jgi:hypothetical protein
MPVHLASAAGGSSVTRCPRRSSWRTRRLARRSGDPAKGLVFDGRLTEDFKLMTGTWVFAGQVRVAALDATAPLLQAAVVCGHEREYVALLAWPNVGWSATCLATPRRAPDARSRTAADRARAREPDRPRPHTQRLLHAHHAPAARRRAAVPGRRRDHRQALRQPARRTRAQQRRRRGALRRTAVTRRPSPGPEQAPPPETPAASAPGPDDRRAVARKDPGGERRSRFRRPQHSTSAQSLPRARSDGTTSRRQVGSAALRR